MNLATPSNDGVARFTYFKAVCQSVWPRQHIYVLLEGKIVSRLHGYKIDTFLRGDPPNLLEVLRQPHEPRLFVNPCGPGNTFTVFWRARFPHLFVASFSVDLFEWCNNNNEKDYKQMIPSEGRPERVRNYMVVA